MATAERAEGSRLDNIDLLRALAIVSVLAYHYTSRWPLDLIRADSLPFRFDLGWSGVDLFFMVSGFCIFMTLDRCRTLATFWARRFARLQPAYVLGVALTFAVVTAFGLPGNQVSVKVALGDLAWFDLHPAWGYVDGAYWSLVVELEFYFCFGLIYFLVRGHHVALAWAVFAAIGSVLVHAEEWHWTLGHQLTVVARTVLIAPYAPAFLIGLIAYESRERLSARMIAPVLLAITLLLVTPRYKDHLWLGLAIAAFASLVFRLERLRLPRAITFIGLISYSLYLVHQFIGLVIIRELAPAIPALLPRIVIATLAVTALAAAMFYTVELRWQKPLARAVDPILESLIGWLPRSMRVVRRRQLDDTPPIGDPRADAARRW